jgi:hypothetical protein
MNLDLATFIVDLTILVILVVWSVVDIFNLRPKD